MKQRKKILITAVNFFSLEEKSRKEILKIRNKPLVRKWMRDNQNLSLSKFDEWQASIKLNNDIAAALIINDEVVGLFHFYRIDLLNQSCKWNFFVDPAFHSTGIGAVILFNMIEFGFLNLGMIKQNVDIVEGHEAAQKLHEKFNFKYEGYRRLEIKKNNKRIGIYEFGITDKEWVDAKKRMSEKITSFDIFNFKVDSRLLD